ncbi:hypothetical protein Hanom_Chr04g00341081 [Helianthus anomalus]
MIYGATMNFYCCALTWPPQVYIFLLTAVLLNLATHKYILFTLGSLKFVVIERVLFSLTNIFPI